MDSALQKLCGTREAALKKDLQGCLPSARLAWRPASSPDGQHCGYLADWRDSEGEQMARANVGLSQQPDGSLQMTWFDVWLAPEHRDQGFFPRLMDVNTQLLASNSHSETQLKLGAGGSGKMGGEQERVGAYLWARLGLFEFDESSRERMATAFEGWLARQAEKHPELTPEICSSLQQRCRTWKPDDYAELDVPFFKLPVERANGTTRQVALGKAFLMDPQTPGWHGACKVNQVDPELLGRARRALNFGGREVEEAPTLSEAELAEKLWSQSQDPERPLRERYHAVELWTMLTGQADPEGIAERFADVFPPERFMAAYQNAHDKPDEPSRILRALLDLDGKAYAAVLAEYAAETGTRPERERLQRFFVESGGYPHRLSALLRSSE